MISYVREPNGSFVVYYTERRPGRRESRRIRRGMQQFLRERGFGMTLSPSSLAEPYGRVIWVQVVHRDGVKFFGMPWYISLLEVDVRQLGKSLTRPILESPATRGGVFALLDEYMEYRQTVPLTSDYLQVKRLDVERFIAQQKQLLEFLSSDPDRSRIEWKLLPEPT